MPSFSKDCTRFMNAAGDEIKVEMAQAISAYARKTALN
jgi:hypothetical protein